MIKMLMRIGTRIIILNPKEEIVNSIESGEMKL